MSNNFKTAVIIILILALIAAGAYIALHKQTIVDDKYAKQYKAIDSLMSNIDKLQQSQLKLDSLIMSHENQIKSIDLSLDSTKKQLKQTRINNGTKIQTASNYTPTEVDSFFANRYQERDGL